MADNVDEDAGAVSVEAAIALCSVLVTFGLLLTGITALTTQIRCANSAREAARLVARGERARVAEVVERMAPLGARLSVRTRGDKIEVEVLAAPIGGLLPGLRVAGRAYAVAEPGAADLSHAEPGAP